MLNLNYLKSTRSLLDDRYELLERIGGGGFSDVWLAHDIRSRVDVVLKIYASSVELDEEGVRMFRKEFSIVCNLNHTNILKPFTFDISQGSPYIVLPYCENGSASKLIGKITEEELWNFAGQVAAGLAYLHRHNIIHQDIKPANVLINADNQYMITDFGISTGLRNTIRKSKSDTDNSGSGTTAYMSVECFGAKPVNVIARDIWAFGATLYELATGDVPFGDYGGVTQKSVGGKVPKIGNDFSSGIKNLIYKCLSFNAWDRPGADEIVEMVNNHKNGVKPSVANPVRKIVAGVSGLVVVSVLCVFTFLGKSGESPVAVNPNDSILLARVEEACEIVMVEKDKGDADAVDEQKLRAAAQMYSEAVMLEATDSIVEKGRSKWMASQKIIDEAYVYFYNKGVEYSQNEAYSAASKFGKRSLVLKEYVSENAKSRIEKNDMAGGKQKSQSKGNETKSKRSTDMNVIKNNKSADLMPIKDMQQII